MVFSADLPPLEGYVQTVDENGNPVYIKTSEQFKKEQGQQKIQQQQEENATLKVQQAQSDEAAISAFEAQAATDEAIIALYEKIGG